MLCRGRLDRQQTVPAELSGGDPLVFPDGLPVEGPRDGERKVPTGHVARDLDAVAGERFRGERKRRDSRGNYRQQGGQSQRNHKTNSRRSTSSENQRIFLMR